MPPPPPVSCTRTATTLRPARSAAGGTSYRRASIVAVRAPDLGPVHPADVVVVDLAQRQPHALLRLRVGEREAAAVPGDPVQPVVAHPLPEIRDRNRRPPGIVEGGIGPRRTPVDEPAVDGGQAAETDPQRLANRGVLRVPPARRLSPRAVAQTQRPAAHPRLDVAAAPRRVDQPDGHPRRSPQLTGEVVPDRREGADVLRVGDRPGPAGEIRGGGLSIGERDLELADPGIVRRRDLRRRAVGGGHRQLHVRLAGRDPHVADQDVVDDDPPRDSRRRPARTARRSRAPGASPARRPVPSDLACAARPCSVTVTAVPGAAHPQTGMRGAALEHHPVAEDPRQAESAAAESACARARGANAATSVAATATRSSRIAQNGRTARTCRSNTAAEVVMSERMGRRRRPRHRPRVRPAKVIR